MEKITRTQLIMKMNNVDRGMAIAQMVMGYYPDDQLQELAKSWGCALDTTQPRPTSSSKDSYNG